HPARGDDVLEAQLAGPRVRGRALVRAADELHEAAPIPEVDEQEPAMIAARVDPAAERDRAADVGGSEIAGEVRPLPVAERFDPFAHDPPSASARTAVASSGPGASRGSAWRRSSCRARSRTVAR